jgi:aspartate/methionine/tyrosine aminotransferase
LWKVLDATPGGDTKLCRPKRQFSPKYGVDVIHTGLPELKDEIAKFYDGLTTDHVIVTSGGSEAIFSIYAALCKPGDHMVCEAPNYPSNYGIPEGLGMEYSLCHMKFEDGYRLNMDDIKSMVKPNTKVRRSHCVCVSVSNAGPASFVLG